jgi:HPt (histidine-containing phosphotransfer) domain-containing protein
MEQGQDIRKAAFEVEVAALRERYWQELPMRRTALDQIWSDCVTGGDALPWRQLRETAHKLAGSAPNYGFDALGAAARKVDQLLSGTDPCRRRSTLRAPVEGLLAALDAAAGGT